MKSNQSHWDSRTGAQGQPVDRRSDRPSLGIALTLLGTGLISLNDAAMKWVIADHPIGEAIFVRGLFVLLPIVLLVRRSGNGWQAARWTNLWGQVLCAVPLVSALFIFIYSLSRLPLSITTIIIYVNPLFVTALAPWLLREKVGWWRWSAVLMGFVGAAMVVRPGDSGFEWIFLAPLAVAFIMALRDIVTRRLVASESTVSILIFSNTAVLLCALPTVFLGWTALSPSDFLLLALAGLGFGFGVYFITDAFRYADASLIAPFKYSGVVFALVLGHLIWSHLPGPEVWFGAALIIVSGIVILWREKVRGTGPPKQALGQREFDDDGSRPPRLPPNA